MKNWLLAISIFLFLACSTEEHPGYSSLDSEGIFYKVLYFEEEGENPAQGDMMRFNMTMYSEGEVWWSTEQVQIIRFDTSSLGLRSELDIFHEGDSLSLIMEPEAVWREFGFLEDRAEKDVDVHIKVLEVIPEKEWLKAESLNKKVNSELEEYLLESFLDTCEYSDEFVMRNGGVLWRTLTPGTGIKYPPWTDMMVNYRAFLMDGTVIDDRMISEDAIAYKIGMQGQLVPGLVEVIRSLEQGEEVEVILPSALAFGSDGSVGGIVPPWHPVRFILRVSLDC